MRTQIAARAAATLERAPALPAFVGFDGFIDYLYHVVDQRRDMSRDGYARLATIPAFAARAASAAGKSANIEMVLRDTRAGGNGPLMSSALSGLGAQVTYIGAIGQPVEHPSNPWPLHPIYADFARSCARIVPIGRPGSTDALEFDDGKLMLNHPEAVQEITWDRLMETVGLEALTGHMRASRVIGLVTWSLMGGVTGLWRGLMQHVFPVIRADGSARRVFVDLADPTRRPDADLREVLGLLGEMDGLIPVTLGLNLSEAERVASVLGLRSAVSYDARGAPDIRVLGEAVRSLAVDIRHRIGVSYVVIHPREGAGACARGALGESTSSWFEGPFVVHPRLSTGAGDHFNAGFAFAQAVGMELDECLALGVATSGAYVRDGRSASRDRIAGLLRALPTAECP